MLYVTQIMKLLGVNQSVAFHVFDLMQIDFSECSKREFNAAVREAYQQFIAKDIRI